MEELDMRPGSELFPETVDNGQYNSYADVNEGHVVDDPLNTGVKEAVDVAGQGQMSDKEMNFRALSDEVAKMKQEREYWRGQAEALTKSSSFQKDPVQTTQQDAFEALDWEDTRDVRKAFEAIREENVRLRSEVKDALVAMETKAQRQDWNNMVTQHVPQLTSKNPIFAEMIQNASNPYEAAYLLAELNAKASSPVMQQAPQDNRNAQMAISNAQKPKTLASAGGSSTLSSADYYASMSDEDFMKIAARNLGNI